MTGFDYSSTASRPAYRDLPGDVRRGVAEALGGPPAEVRLAGGGFTPGFAATVRRGGASLFVKAAPESSAFAYPAYVQEASLLAALPAGLPIPRLLSTQHLGADGPGEAWVLLVIEHIAGTLPGGPWTQGQAEAVHAALVDFDGKSRRIPAHLATGSMTDGLTDDEAVMGVFGRCATGGRSPRFLPALGRRHWLELQGLVDRAPSLLTGSAMVHNDLRPDNIILERSSGRALVCDWNFLTRGPAWADWVALLPYLHHDGLDADAWIGASPLSAGVPAEAIDSWLAVLAAYMVVSGLAADVPTSPRLRAHNRFTAGIVVDWLSERREWTV